MVETPLRRGESNSRTEHYPRFSEEEYDRRESNVRELMDEYDIDSLLIYSTGGIGTGKLTYLTNYQPSFPTYFIFFRETDKESTIFSGISNHVQYITEVSTVNDVRLVLPDTKLSDTPVNIVNRIKEAGVDTENVGIVGGDVRYNIGLPHDHHKYIENSIEGDLVDITGEYTKLISIAGEEEHENVRQAAKILDKGMEALEETLEPGVTETELGKAFHGTCTELGGHTSGGFIMSASTENPELGEGVTWKHPSNRTIQDGDVVTTELTVSVNGYSSQIHRPYTVGSPPTDTYQEMFGIAEEMYERSIDALQPGNTPRDVYEAMIPVEEATDYKIYDVMSHGLGIDYQHPFIGVHNSNYWPGAEDPLTENWTYEPGMVIVTQPNVLTPDESKGLQFGTTVIIQEDGPEVVQEYPAEFIQV